MSAGDIIKSEHVNVEEKKTKDRGLRNGARDSAAAGGKAVRLQVYPFTMVQQSSPLPQIPNPVALARMAQNQPHGSPPTVARASSYLPPLPHSSQYRFLLTEHLTYDKFFEEVDRIFKGEVKTENIKAFFKKVNNNPDVPVDWSELFGYYQSEERGIYKGLPVFMVSKRQRVVQSDEDRTIRDVIQCIINLPQLDQNIIASQKGRILLYNNKENAQVTGCDYLYQLKRIVATTETSIVIWDHKPKSKSQANYFTLRPVQNIPLCVCTLAGTENLHEDGILIGDDGGYVSLIILGSDDFNPKKSKETDGTQSQILDPRFLRRPIMRRKLHSEWVLKVKFFTHLNCFASCSSDSIHSLVLDHIQRIEDCQAIRTLAVPRGINTFAYCVKANSLATGGCDKIIRLWNPNIFSKPKAMLLGHQCIITEIAVNEIDQHIISLSTEGMFRIWDIQTLAVLQVFISNEPQVGDKRINTIVFDRKHKRLIIGSCVIDVLPLMSAVQDTMQIPLSHEKSILVVTYNKVKNQVVSICSTPIIKMWQVETGEKMYQIVQSHGPDVELTAAALDKSGSHLITGAFDGSLKLWEFATGEEIKSLPPAAESSEEDRSICQLTFLRQQNPRLILALTWNNTIQIIQDTTDVSDLTIISVIPDIVSSIQKSSGLPFENRNLFLQSEPEKEECLVNALLSCFDTMQFKNEELLAFGWLSLIVLWDINSTSIKKIMKEDRISTEDDNTAMQKFIQNMDLLKVRVVKFLVHRNIKLEAENAKKSSQHSLQPPLILIKHSKSRISLKAKGKQLEKVLPTIQFSHPITALCTDENANVLLAGNQRGYISAWNIESFLDDPYLLNRESVNRVISWRAHSLKIVSMFYVDSKSVVVSASLDCSLRLWYAPKGHYIGYFGQHSALNLMPPTDFMLPSDIAEGPVETKSKKFDKSDSVLDYPLKLDWERWKPFDREAYLLKQQRKVLDVDHDKKFFNSVTIPRLKSTPVQNSISGKRAMGAVFRALPVYNIVPLFKITGQLDELSKARINSPDSIRKFFVGRRRGSVHQVAKVAKRSLQTAVTCKVFKTTTLPSVFLGKDKP
eukprot:gi/632953034/ref/XP_007892176.1/ PREDICTED: WD repeat-containing protein 64 [Callorhinchus milii]